MSNIDIIPIVSCRSSYKLTFRNPWEPYLWTPVDKQNKPEANERQQKLLRFDKNTKPSHFVTSTLPEKQYTNFRFAFNNLKIQEVIRARSFLYFDTAQRATRVFAVRFSQCHCFCARAGPASISRHGRYYGCAKVSCVPPPARRFGRLCRWFLDLIHCCIFPNIGYIEIEYVNTNRI